jgi:hypothetical protein
MMRSHWILTATVVGFCCCVNGNDFKGFDDNILFSLNWPGAELLVGFRMNFR